MTASTMMSPRVGAAQADITPEAGMHIAGTIHMYRPAAFALDPLYARDGSIAMPGGGRPIDPRSRSLEGPIDPELGCSVRASRR